MIKRPLHAPHKRKLSAGEQRRMSALCRSRFAVHLTLVASTLIIAYSAFAADAMKEALARRGHAVIAATDFSQVRQSCADLRFDLVVIGDAIPPRIKKALALDLKRYCPDSPVLEICTSQPCIAEADYFLQKDSFDALSQKISEILHAGAKRRSGS